MLRRIIFPVSYLLLFAFIAMNWRLAGVLVVGVGALLNFSAIVTNGGLMPISPAIMERAGYADELAELELGDAVPTSKNVLLDEADTNLHGLSDRFTWDPVGVVSVYSIGDMIIAAGLVLILVGIVVSIAARPSRDRPSPA